MSVLSAEWRWKWLSIPDLVFNEDHLQQHKTSMDHAEIVDHTLPKHLGLIYKFSINLSCVDGDDISRWIDFLSWNEIKQLILIFRSTHGVVPSTLFNCQGLCYFLLYGCKLVVHSITKGFPSLKGLYLSHVAIAEDALARLISNCPLLEGLTLRNMAVIKCLKIDAPNLRSLTWHGGFVNILLESSPLLVDVSAHLWPCTRTADCIKQGEHRSLIMVLGCSPVIEEFHVTSNLSKVTLLQVNYLLLRDTSPGLSIERNISTYYVNQFEKNRMIERSHCRLDLGKKKKAARLRSSRPRGLR